MANEHEDKKTPGAAVAAFLSASLGILALGVTQVLCEKSEAIKNSVQDLGKLWIPGAAGIGPYSGKETIELVVWLTSWFALHFLLRKKDISIRWSSVLFLVILGTATTLLWPPVTHVLAGGK